MDANTVKTIIFILHFFFFGLTVLAFVLKLHKKDKAKYAMYAISIVWIIFGSIDFILELINIISMYI